MGYEEWAKRESAKRRKRTTLTMKLEDFPNLYFVVSVLVPGFIYSGVVANFVPM
jgi:hypothetical protein